MGEGYVQHNLSRDDYIKNFQMTGKMHDLTGKKFGNLLVIGVYKVTKRRRLWWLVECQCGSGYCFAVDGRNLTRGINISCPYCKSEVASEIRKVHGDSHTRLYYIWNGMIQRCEKQYSPSYNNYGARGITVCKEWHDYIAFRDWSINHGYANNLSIDRIDYNGNYCPENCRWADDETQSNNRRTNIYLTAFGKTMTIAQWSRYTGINKASIEYRYQSKYFNTDEEIIFGKNLIYYKGEL